MFRIGNRWEIMDEKVLNSFVPYWFIDLIISSIAVCGFMCNFLEKRLAMAGNSLVVKSVVLQRVLSRSV